MTKTFCDRCHETLFQNCHVIQIYQCDIKNYVPVIPAICTHFDLCKVCAHEVEGLIRAGVSECAK
jgi:hypothetical protein